MLAHRVAGPRVERERASILLWRFHRRAGDDSVGHSLSLLTYAPREINERLCRLLKEDQTVMEMIEAQLLDKVECEGFAGDREHLVEATSDSRWSPSLQRAWPYYIMGVSEMWLRLLDEHARRLADGAQPRTLAQTGALYRNVHDSVTQAWRSEGEHAFLHHLSGLFGYEALTITEKKLHRF